MASKFPYANLNEATAARMIRNVKPSQIVLITLSPHSLYPVSESIADSGFWFGEGRQSLNTRLITIAKDRDRSAYVICLQNVDGTFAGECTLDERAQAKAPRRELP